MPNLALFDIDADGLDQGVDVVNGATITLTLRQSPPIGIRSVVYQVFDAAAFDPGFAIAANPPRSTKAATELVLDNGAGGTGQAVAPVLADGPVTTTIPAAPELSSWLIRCVVDGGVDADGRPDADRIWERLIAIRDAAGLRKIIATETTQYEDDGWAEAFNEAVGAAAAGVVVTVFRWDLSGPYSAAIVPGRIGPTQVVRQNLTIDEVVLQRNDIGTAGTTRVDLLVGGVSRFAGDPQKPQVTPGDGVQAVDVVAIFTSDTLLVGDLLDAELEAVETYALGPPEGPEGLWLEVRCHPT